MHMAMHALCGEGTLQGQGKLPSPRNACVALFISFCHSNRTEGTGCLCSVNRQWDGEGSSSPQPLHGSEGTLQDHADSSVPHTHVSLQGRVPTSVAGYRFSTSPDAADTR